jgi:predicted RNA-binding protein
MCESNAYLLEKDGSENLIMENVDYVRPEGQKILLRSIFGEEKTVEARIREMNLTSHRILLQHP